MYTYTPANSTFDGSVTNLTFRTVHLDTNPFACSFEGGKKVLMVSDLALLVLLVGRSPSDGYTSMAVKGLITTSILPSVSAQGS